MFSDICNVAVFFSKITKFWLRLFALVAPKVIVCLGAFLCNNEHCLFLRFESALKLSNKKNELLFHAN